MAALNIAPVVVALDGITTLQTYKSGIINTNRCGTTLDHSILLVGYNNTAAAGKTPYFIGKN